jgi:hypothetical protein
MDHKGWRAIFNLYLTGPLFTLEIFRPNSVLSLGKFGDAV